MSRSKEFKTAHQPAPWWRPGMSQDAWEAARKPGDWERRGMTPQEWEARSTGLEGLAVGSLAQNVRTLKSKMIPVLDADPERAQRLGGKNRVTPAEGFHAHHAMLRTHERELIKRGLDPTHPSFGPDLSGLLKPGQ